MEWGLGLMLLLRLVGRGIEVFDELGIERMEVIEIEHLHLVYWME